MWEISPAVVCLCARRSQQPLLLVVPVKVVHRSVYEDGSRVEAGKLVAYSGV